MSSLGTLAGWLDQVGLSKLEPVFRDNSIDLDIVRSLTDADLKELGLALGDRKRVMAAIAAMDKLPPRASSPSGPVPQARGEAERRQLTVMFVDLVGSTELSRQLDPEELREVILGYQNTVAGEIGRFDGHVAKFMGDGVLAYFGWPQGHEDDAERSVRAALAIAGAVCRLATPAGEPLSARIGIATGLVVVGDLIGEGAAQEHAVVGETPNLAARLQALAEPGSVVIAPGTRALVGGHFELADLGAHSLKGYADPVRAWRVVREGSAESRFEAMHGGTLTPLIGREHELGMLLERFERARDGEGQVVLLSGQPGIGKSRAVSTLRERLVGEDCLALSHFCSPFHTNSALHPIIGLLERAAGFERDEPAADRCAKLENLLTRGDMDVGESASLLASLLSIAAVDRYPPLDLTPEVQKQRTLKLLLDYLTSLAARQPLLAVYEDVHWSDPSTLELLGQLIERAERLPILVIITFRPEFIPPWPGHSHIAALPLAHLARRQGAAMIAAVAGGKTLPAEVLDQIVARTDGVPLFVEELTRTLLESGLLQDRGNNFVLNGPLSSLAIPTTLHDLLLARLDRLGPARETAQLAAALGREFPHELLAAVSPLGDTELRAALARIVDAGLVFSRGSPPDATYTFKHALVRDAAYAGLLKSRRLQIHSRIAEVLKDRFSEQVATAPEVLAHHYGEAGLTELAIASWERAGTHALERSACIEAVAHYRAGLAWLERLPQDRRYEPELSLQIGLGSALSSIKGYADLETGAVYQRARQLCLKIDDPRRLFPVLYGLWNFENVGGRHENAKSIAEDLVALAEQHGDSGPIIAGYSALGTTLTFMGAWPQAHASFEKCTALYDVEKHASMWLEYTEDPCVAAYTVDTLCLWHLGYPECAAVSIDRADLLAKRLGHANSIAFPAYIRLTLQLLLGNTEAASLAGEASLAHAKAHGLAFWESFSTIYLGSARSRRGETADGIANILAGSDMARATGADVFLSWHQGVLAEAYLAVRRYDEARQAADEGIATAAHQKEGVWLAGLHRTRALVELQRDDPDVEQGEEWLVRSLDVARSQGSKSMELRVATDLAQLWSASGRTTEARELLGPIRDWFEEGFDTEDYKNASSLLKSLS